MFDKNFFVIYSKKFTGYFHKDNNGSLFYNESDIGPLHPAKTRKYNSINIATNRALDIISLIPEIHEMNTTGKVVNKYTLFDFIYSNISKEEYDHIDALDHIEAEKVTAKKWKCYKDARKMMREIADVGYGDYFKEPVDNHALA